MNSVWEQFKSTVARDMKGIASNKKADNPLAALNRYLKQAEQQTEATGKLLDRQKSLNEKLEKELAQAIRMRDKREAQSGLAEAAGEEELIRFARAETAAYAERAATIETALAESLAELNDLEQRYEEMMHRLADMRIRQLQLMGKENITRAHFEIDKVLAPEEAADAVGGLDEGTEYIRSLTNQVEDVYERSALKRRLESLQKTDADEQKIV